MSLRIVIDMNLSPDSVPFLNANGWPAEQWSTIGDPRATDSVIMAWSLANQCVVLTHDLDFGMLLAITNARGPSVLQVRTQNVRQEDQDSRSRVLSAGAGETATGTQVVVAAGLSIRTVVLQCGGSPSDD